MFKMHKKHLPLRMLRGGVVLLASISSIAHADTIVRQVVSTGGEQMIAGGNTLTYTIGQPICTDYSSQLNSGFWIGIGGAESVSLVDAITVVNTPVCPNDPFDVTFKIIATPEQPLEGVQLYVKFDPAILKVNKISNGTTLDFVLRNEVNGAGYINFAAASFINPPPTSAFDLMTVNFTALQKSAGTLLEIDTNNSNLQSDGNYLPLQANDTTLVIGDCLKCRVNLQGRKAKPHKSWSTALDIHTDDIQSTTTDNRGICNLPTTVSTGNHSFCVKNSHTLANKVGPPIKANKIVDLGTLLEGDVNDDNKINFDDVKLLRSALGKCAGQNGYNANADLNADDCVNDKDKSVAFGDGNGGSSNFGIPSACSLDSKTNTLRKGRRGRAGAVTLSTTKIPVGLAVGSSFDVAIQVNADEAQSIDGTTAYLNFDPERVQVNKLTAGDNFDFVLQSSFDNSTGEINFAATSWAMAFPKGSFKLVTINLTLLKWAGAESLSFNTAGDRKTDVVSDGESVIVPDPENVGEIVIDLPEVPDENDSNVEGLPDPNDSSDGIEEVNTEGLPDPNDGSDGINDGDYTASGTIRDELGNPVTGVTVQLEERTVITNDVGYWEIPDLQEGKYTITASKAGYTFAPETVELGNDEFAPKIVLPLLSALKVKLVVEPRYPKQGEDITIINTIINGGGEKATGIILNNTLPNGFRIVDIEVSNDVQCDAGAKTCTLPDLIPGGTAIVKLVVNNPDANQSVIYSATLTSNEYPADVSQQRIQIIPHLSVNVNCDPKKVMPEAHLYCMAEVVLSSLAPSAATGIEMVMTLPNGVELQSVEPDGLCDSNLPILTCSLTDLTPDGINSATVSFEEELKDPGLLLLTHEAKVTANEYPAHTGRARTKIFIPPEYQVDMAFVIDVTGSMNQEMDAAKEALKDFIAQYDPSLFPLTALVIFRDEVTVKAVTTDMEIVVAAIDKMKPLGGGTCPEASVEALDIAITHIKQGGTLFFVTDASPYSDSDVIGIYDRAKAKEIVFSAIITGDCSDRESWNILSE
jgi:hypothetical protein